MTRGRAIESVPEETPLGSTFRENAVRIYRFIYAKVGNRAAAEDLTSEVFLKAVRWLAQDRSAESIRAWLYIVARSTIADYWRQQSRQPTVPLEDPDAVLFCGTEGPQEVRRTRERAWRILEALPERERDVLRLRFLHGYTAPEMDARVPPGNVCGTVLPGNARIRGTVLWRVHSASKNDDVQWLRPLSRRKWALRR